MYYGYYKDDGIYDGFYTPEIHCKLVPIYNDKPIEQEIKTLDEDGNEQIEIIVQEPGTVQVGEEYDLSTIPTPNIELTTEQWQEALIGDYKVIDGKHIYSPPPEPSLNELKEIKWNKIKTIRNNLEQSGVPYLGKILDSDTLSVQRISIAVQAAQTAVALQIEFDLPWTMQDNSVIVMSAQEVIGMSVALAQYSGQLHEKARLLRIEIDHAETKEELDEIVWSK